MSKKSELSKIKKIYGEDFMHLCREMFPTILEDEGKLLEILGSRFSRNCSGLYEAITGEDLQYDFKNLIYSDYDKMRESKEEKQEEEVKTPYEILDEAGYELHECTSEREIQAFRKYYVPNEVLCTIYNGGRLRTDVVYFAVKKDADKIKREDFPDPKKDDEYSLSVLGIQFDKREKSDVQIISRYNHTVPNPNCTLNNDLENLAPGLTESFARVLEERGYYLDAEKEGVFEIPGYTIASDGKYYKYNMEIDGDYYCPGNIVIRNGEAQSIGDSANTILVDYFAIDMREKTVRSLADTEIIKDSFSSSVGDIKNIKVEKTDEGKKITIEKEEGEPVEIGINENSEIIEYVNNNVEQVENDFLAFNEKLRTIKLPNVRKIRTNFLNSNVSLEKLELPQVEQIVDYFLQNGGNLKKLKLPNVRSIGNDFLCDSKILETVELPKVEEISDNFLYSNYCLRKLELPEVRNIGYCFLKDNTEMREIKLPKVKQIGADFLPNNIFLREINLPQVEQVGDEFLYANYQLRRVELPNLKNIGNHFLVHNVELEEIELPKVEQIGDYFLSSNNNLRKVELPNVKDIGNDFLWYNRGIKEIELPKVEQVGDSFLYANNQLRRVELPNVKRIGDEFLLINNTLKEIELPQVHQVGSHFLYFNKTLDSIVISDKVNLKDVLNKTLYQKFKFTGVIDENGRYIVKKKHDMTEVEEVAESRKTDDIKKFLSDSERIIEGGDKIKSVLENFEFPPNF